jgi:hypothetical protein
MLLTDPVLHSASIHIDGEAGRIFSLLSDGDLLGKWAFGSWGNVSIDGGLFKGSSLFNGGDTYVRIVPNPSILQVDYLVGTPDRLLPRIVARVVRGEQVGRDASSSLVTMLSWRTSGMDDERWRLTCSAHEAEVFRMKHVFETELGALS